MRRLVVILLAAFLSMSFAGCQETSDAPAMYIQKAELTEEEQNITELLGVEGS